MFAHATSGTVEPLGCVAIVVLYAAVATAAWGQTAGKRALRLRVLDVASRRPPALIDAVMRVAVLVLPLVVLGLWGRTAWEMGGWLLLVAAPALGGERRCLHDLVARTQVVQLA